MTNLNDKIIIQLTPEGVRFFKNYMDSLETIGYYPGLNGEMLTIKLWEFAYIFGQELYMGNTKQLHSMNFEYV